MGEKLLEFSHELMEFLDQRRNFIDWYLRLAAVRNYLSARTLACGQRLAL